MYECIIGRPPFYDRNSEIMKNKILTHPLEFPEDWDEDLKDLLKGMLEKDVEKRFGDEEVLGHKYFAGVDWDKVASKTWQDPIWKPVLQDDSDPGSDTKYIIQQWKAIIFSDWMIYDLEQTFDDDIFIKWEYKFC